MFFFNIKTGISSYIACKRICFGFGFCVWGTHGCHGDKHWWICEQLWFPLSSCFNILRVGYVLYFTTSKRLSFYSKLRILLEHPISKWSNFCCHHLYVLVQFLTCETEGAILESLVSFAFILLVSAGFIVTQLANMKRITWPLPAPTPTPLPTQTAQSRWMFDL